MIRGLVILAGVAAVAIPSSVRAETTFEAAAAGARKIAHVEDLVWAMTTPCDHGDDVQLRQCRAIRDHAAASLAGATLVVEADPDALALGRYSTAKKSVSVTLTGCIRCGAGVTVDGKRWQVTAGTPRLDGGQLRAPALYDTARQFADEATANAWLAAIAHHRVELVVRIPAKPRWQVGGKDGLQLEVLAYRVITPCTGMVVIANPPAQNAAPDKTACPAAPAAP